MTPGNLNLSDLDSLHSDLDTLHDILYSVEYTQEYEPLFKAISEQTHVSVSVVREMLEIVRSAARTVHSEENRKRNEQATRSA